MDLKDIKELIRILDKSEINELEWEDDDSRIYLSKTGPVQYAQPMMQMPAAPVQAQAAGQAAGSTVEASPESAPAEAGKPIDSPMIGTFYEAPSPGASAFVKVGDLVEKGQTLCIIEAMKIMNTIEADFRCKILKILVQNGNPVEYGQPIFIVEPM